MPAYLYHRPPTISLANMSTCEVPRARTSMVDRLFTVAVPRLWNNLLLRLRDYELILLGVPPQRIYLERSQVMALAV